VSATIPELGTGVSVLTTTLQLVVSRNGKLLPGPAATLTMLDGSFRGALRPG